MEKESSEMESFFLMSTAQFKIKFGFANGKALE